MSVFATPQVISAGIGLLGGILGGRSSQRSQEKTNAVTQANNQWEQNFALSEQARLQRNRKQDIKLQKKFMKEGAGWQFDDLMQAADEAGIHRLAAIGGAQGGGYQPVQTQAVTGPSLNTVSPTNDQWLGDAIGEAMRAYDNSKENLRADALTNAQVQALEADAELSRAQSRTQIQNQRRQTNSQPSRERQFPTVLGLDLGSMRPEDHRIAVGEANDPELEGKYVLAYEGRYYATGWNTPAGSVAELLGEIAGESTVALSTETWNTLIGSSREVHPVAGKWSFKNPKGLRLKIDTPNTRSPLEDFWPTER